MKLIMQKKTDIDVLRDLEVKAFENTQKVIKEIEIADIEDIQFTIHLFSNSIGVSKIDRAKG